MRSVRGGGERLEWKGRVWLDVGGLEHQDEGREGGAWNGSLPCWWRDGVILIV